MHFQHAARLRADFPELVAGAVIVDGITRDAAVDDQLARYHRVARERLAAGGPESNLPEIQAWRRTFATMGLKPTQYRCAAEALLRRFRKEDDLPRIRPLVDLCNAVSVAFAIPVAVLDVAHIASYLEVGYADGDETYLTFSGEVEHPDPGEVVFVDAEKRAHARRWCNRQSGLSAAGDDTSSVLIVAEALHESADEDVLRLTEALVRELADVWSVKATASILTADAPRVEF